MENQRKLADIKLRINTNMKKLECKVCKEKCRQELVPVTIRKLKSDNPLPAEFCQIASKAGIMGETSVSLARKPSLVKSFAISA